MAVQNYWNQSYAANQQAQQAGMPQGANYQSPTGYQAQAPQQQQAWAAPTQGSWNQPSSQPQQPRSSSAQAPSGWGQYQAAPSQGGQAAAPQSWWQQGGQQPAYGGGGWAQPQQQTPSQGSWGGGGGDPYSTLAQAYQQYLGRTPSKAEMDSYLQHGSSAGNLQTYAQQIKASQEAAAYQQQAQPQGGPMGPPAWWQQGGSGGYPGGGGGGMPMPPGANTDGFRPPQMTVMPRGGPMPGWEANKWNDPNHQTPKYVVGRILSQFSPRTENMDAVVAAIAQAYPGTRRSGAGDITIPGVGSTDILQSAGAGGKAWQFLGQGQGGGGGQQAPGGGGYGGFGGGDIYTSMFNQLMQQQQPQAQPVRQAAAPDNSQYLSQIQQLQTQLQEMQAQLAQNRGLRVTYF